MTQHTTLHDHAYRFIVVVCIALATGWLVYQYVSQQRIALVQSIEVHIQEAETLLHDMVTQAGYGQYTEMTGGCRQETQDSFDGLLNQLGSNLSESELQFIAIHFDRCAGTFALEQRLYAEELASQVALLFNMHKLIDSLVGATESKEHLQSWQKLVAAEASLAETQRELVEAQRELILLRLGGSATDSEEISLVLQRVQEDIRPAIKEDMLKRQQHVNALRI